MVCLENIFMMYSLLYILAFFNRKKLQTAALSTLIFRKGS